MKVQTRGFTLIELLVVVAVIAILAALLFPVSQKALASGKDAACIANLRSLGNGMHLMLQDHDGMFPGGYDTIPVWDGNPTGPSAMIASGIMAEYMGVSPFNNPGLGKLACPSARWPGYQAGSNPRLYYGFFLGYGANPALCPYPLTTNHARIVNIQRPSQVIVLGDAGQQGNGASPFFIQWSGKYDQMRPGNGGGDPAAAEIPVEPSYFSLSWMPEPLLPTDRHHGKGHFLFVDGHVAALGIGEIREKNIFWNY